MAFVHYNGKIGKASKDAVRIDGKGRVYIPNSHNVEGNFELLWDADTNRIGLHPQENGTRRLTDAKDGRISSIKGMLDELGIPYPQICPVAWDGDIYTLKVTTS